MLVGVYKDQPNDRSGVISLNLRQYKSKDLNSDSKEGDLNSDFKAGNVVLDEQGDVDMVAAS